MHTLTNSTATFHAIERLKGEVSILETKYHVCLEKDVIFEVLKHIRNQIKWTNIQIDQIEHGPELQTSEPALERNLIDKG